MATQAALPISYVCWATFTVFKRRKWPRALKAVFFNSGKTSGNVFYSWNGKSPHAEAWRIQFIAPFSSREVFFNSSPSSKTSVCAVQNSVAKLHCLVDGLGCPRGHVVNDLNRHLRRDLGVVTMAELSSTTRPLVLLLGHTFQKRETA